VFKVNEKLMSMLKTRHKSGQLVFGGTNLNSHRRNYYRQRMRLARKLSNPRLLKISFHILRHWKATMQYHKTKDILHVKRLLGHRKLESTMMYIELVTFDNPEEFTCRATENIEEAKELIEAGFEYVTDIEDKKLFRKRK